MRRYEVRCCCEPKKLLGWLRAPENVTVWAWAAIKPVPWSRITQPDQATAAVRISLPIADFIKVGENGEILERYRAIKAEGYTVEDLINIRGFEPAP